MSNVRTALERSTLLLATSTLYVCTVVVIFIVVAVDVTGALFSAHCLNVFFLTESSVSVFFVYLTLFMLPEECKRQSEQTEWTSAQSRDSIKIQNGICYCSS